jgi:trk system potassium uptake protein
MGIKRLINVIGDKLNFILYNSKSNAYNAINLIRLLSSIGALALIIYGYGFELPQAELDRVFYGLDILFGIFVITYLGRFLYAFRKRDFLYNNMFEGILMAIIMVNGFNNYVLGHRFMEEIMENLGIENYRELSQVFIVFYMLIILGLEFTKASSRLSKVKLEPSSTFILSFIILILIGTGLLMLPAMTVENGSMPFLKALFTSVSASCVTGLIVVDTATYFTFKGQVVIMVLFQLGGLGIISFASFFATVLKQGVGIKHQLMLQDFLSTESLFSTKGLLSQIFIATFIIETAGAILVFATWSPEIHFESLGEKIFFSIFHTISAFCNAGFSLFSDGLYEPIVRDAYILHIVIIILVILGGIGFPTLQDLFSPTKLRERLANPWKNWHLSTKISVYMALFLLAFGCIFFFLLEKDNTLKGLNFSEALITSFFQSGTTRSSGFNSVDMSQVKIPTLIIMIFLMFIGGSSGSIAGGIKTSTFYLILTSVIATIRGKLKIEIGKRYIPNTLLFKALSIFVFAVSMNSLGIFVLSITDPDIEFIRLVFEHVSAFGTVGLSTGITSELSNEGLVMIISSMFLGRVGTLTFAIALSTRVSTQNYKYPRAHLLVG